MRINLQTFNKYFPLRNRNIKENQNSFSPTLSSTNPFAPLAKDSVSISFGKKDHCSVQDFEVKTIPNLRCPACGLIMLTDKQEKFCKAIVEGMTQADAYRSAYDSENMADKTIYEAASRLMADSNIIARVQELRDLTAKASILTAQERLEWLSEIIRSKEESTTDRLKASDQMNKMQGEYIEKIKADINVKRLEDVL